MPLIDNHSPYAYVCGVFPSLELMKARPGAARSLLLHPGAYGNEGVQKLIEIFKALGKRMEEAPALLKRISGKENAYAAVMFERYDDDLLDTPRHLVLHNLSDCGNLGSILRSALGFGFYDVAIIKPSAELFGSATVRASMGAQFHLRVAQFASMDEYREAFPGRVIAPLMLMAGAAPIRDAARDVKPPFSLVLGNEASGLPADFSRYGDPVVIPHSKEVDSLNVSVAAGIAMFLFS